MARLITEWAAEIEAEKNSRPELAALNSHSAVSIWKLIRDTFAFFAWILETLFEKHRAEVDEKISKNQYGIFPWYAELAKRFQLNDTVEVINGIAQYPDGSTGAKIITRATAKPTPEGIIFLKVAKDGAAPDELEPLTEYDPAIGTKVIEEFENSSQGARYSHYYASLQVGSSGANLYRMALALHIMINFKVWVLDADGNFIQPVTFTLEYGEPNEVTVTPVDGVAPFEYSTDGEIYGSENILTFEEQENAIIYVKDSAGTIASVSADTANWNAVVNP